MVVKGPGLLWCDGIYCLEEHLVDIEDVIPISERGGRHGEVAKFTADICFDS